MSFYLEVPFVDINRQVAVDIPAPTNSGGYNFEIEFEVKLVGSELVVAGTSLSSTSNIFFLKSSILEYRNTGNTTINMTHGVNASDWHVYRFVFTGTGAGNIAFYVDGLFKSNYTPSSSIATQALGALFGLGGNSSRTGDFRYFQFTDFNNSAANRMYDARAHTPGDTVLQETANNADGTFSTAWAALPPNFVADAPVVTPISFTGSIPNQTFTAGDTVDVDLVAGRYAGTETPFNYSNVGAALTGTGLSITSAGRLQGTATEAAVTGVVMRGTDSATNTADSNAFNVTVNAVAQVPQGTVTIGTITKTDTTANIPYTYSAADETGFEYRIDGGSAVADAASPVDLTGLTAETTYTIEVRAINAAGPGAWSAVGNFTTDATPVVTATFTSEALKDNTGTLLASEPLDYVALYDNASGALVVRVTGISTDANAQFAVTDAALTSSAVYKVDWKVTSQAQGRMPAKAAV